MSGIKIGFVYYLTGSETLCGVPFRSFVNSGWFMRFIQHEDSGRPPYHFSSFK
jgi:hypothetical protein